MSNILDRVFKIVKEAKQLGSKDMDPELKAWITKKYGEMDDRDFISADGDTYFKTDVGHKSEGGGISHSIIKLPSFSELIIQLKKTKDVANNLIKNDATRDDEVLRDIHSKQNDIFNRFRTHIRKEYPAFYAQLKSQLGSSMTEDLEEISSSGAAGGYLTPYAFRLSGSKPNDKAYTEIGYSPVKEDVGASLGPGPKASRDGVKDNSYVKDYGYKLVPPKIKGSGLEVKQLFEDSSVSDFQQERIMAFDLIEYQLNDIYKILSNAKNETANYYSENPTSYAVVKPTDLILDYIKDIKDLLKGE